MATESEASNEGTIANGDVESGVASVSAREPLQIQQLGDPDVGPVLRLCLQHIEKPDMDQLLAESEATKILWSYWQQLEFHDSVLYRRRIGTKGRPDTLQLLVPAALKEDYMKRAHTGVCGGHMGLRRTLDQVQRRAFWIGWRRDVRRYCRKCPNCNSYFRGRLPKSASLQPLITGAPFERLHIDLTGPHPRRGSVYIITCINPFTKWAEAFPAPARITASPPVGSRPYGASDGHRSSGAASTGTVGWQLGYCHLDLSANLAAAPQSATVCACK